MAMRAGPDRLGVPVGVTGCVPAWWVNERVIRMVDVDPLVAVAVPARVSVLGSEVGLGEAQIAHLRVEQRRDGFEKPRVQGGSVMASHSLGNATSRSVTR